MRTLRWWPTHCNKERPTGGWYHNTFWVPSEPHYNSFRDLCRALQWFDRQAVNNLYPRIHLRCGR